MDETTSMIEKATTDLEGYWKSRDAQIIKDREIINLVKPPQTSDKLKWMDNEPKAFFDTSRALISLYPPRFRLPLTINYNPEEKQKMNKAERLNIGIFRLLNRKVTDRGGVNWLWDLAYYVLLGWYTIFNVATESKDGVDFCADIWDPLTVYPKWDSLGLVQCVRTFDVDKITAIAMATEFAAKGLDFDFKEPGNDRSKIINYWQRRMIKGKPVIENAILIAGQPVKPLTVQRKLRRIPIQVGAIGSPDTITPNWEVRKGESIIAANRDMYEYSNSMISLMATILASQAFPEIIEKTISGREAYKAEDYKGYGGKKTLKLNESIELLKTATTPQEANILMSWVGQQRQKASVPNSVYGALPFEVSGFALSQLLAAIKYKLGPYLNAMQSILSNVMTDLLYQYKAGKYSEITLSTLNPYDLKRGMTYIEEFTTEDVPEHLYVDVTIPITSQFDKTQAILNARQALGQPQIFSRETLWETELDIQDTEQEYERIRQDQVMEDPFIRQIEILEKMWERVEMYREKGNNLMAEALKRYIMGLETQIGIRQGVLVKPGEEGIPPQLRPPEMGMSPSPDQTRAMTGTPPPGLTRRPQTPEERARSQGGVVAGV